MTVIKKGGVFFCILAVMLFFSSFLLAYEETITISASDAKGALVSLDKGKYKVEIAGGAMTLFYPINPNYCWLVGIAVGTQGDGGQNNPDIGTIYFEPNPEAYTQAEAEELALQAVKENVDGTSLEFSLEEDTEVRFWVSDFDYTDNSGMIKLKIILIGE